jgi:hypothetical protein
MDQPLLDFSDAALAFLKLWLCKVVFTWQRFLATLPATCTPPTGFQTLELIQALRASAHTVRGMRHSS